MKDSGCYVLPSDSASFLDLFVTQRLSGFTNTFVYLSVAMTCKLPMFVLTQMQSVIFIFTLYLYSFYISTGSHKETAYRSSS